MSVSPELLFKINLFSGCAGSFCCAWAFSSCDVWVSHCGGLSSCGSWALGVQASEVVACGLSSCDAQGQLPCSMWNLPRPGSNLCALHWRADS